MLLVSGCRARELLELLAPAETRAMFQNILVPFDLSEVARSAFGHALVLARAGRGSVDVLHVVEPHYPSMGGAVGSAMSLAAADLGPQSTFAQEQLSTLENRLAAVYGVEVRTKVVTGVLPDTILEEGRVLGSQLVVMATHGRTGLKRWLLGSVTERVLRLCPMPVLVARGGGPMTTPMISRITVAIDFSEYSLRALDLAQKMANLLSAKLTLVHVIPNPVYIEGAYVDPRPLEASQGDARDALNRLAQERGLQAVSEAVVGSPSSTLESFVQETPTDLLVLGTHGRRGLKRALLGSVAEQTVRYAPCACLVVP